MPHTERWPFQILCRIRRRKNDSLVYVFFPFFYISSDCGAAYSLLLLLLHILYVVVVVAVIVMEVLLLSFKLEQMPFFVAPRVCKPQTVETLSLHPMQTNYTLYTDRVLIEPILDAVLRMRIVRVFILSIFVCMFAIIVDPMTNTIYIYH